ncbi:hypothetical protein GA0074696_6074 [Micromonospora purpureochromogenes]|uniref:DUF748 domain-containing protein n=1 Tax=Micromonospora purpureochromogenes TaxID=47872 RepID=A0A1C5AI87_9ACTN|nr:hypothetical protein [Micromonospora purpureochromogenes]SCF44879.1 hypothetical protein GA0074696_6074 [Micromonospora purpureochromogenes]
MNTATKLSGFALGLAAVFGTAYGVGHLAGPVTPAADTRHEPAGADHGSDPHGGSDSHGGEPAGAAHLPGGLLVSDRGYTMQPVDAPTGQFAFRITGPGGAAVTGYEVAHDKRMHLIVARRDLSGFRHVHPELGADGTWRVDSPLGGPGVWRAFADFTPSGGEPLTLGVDVTVPGQLQPRPLPAPAASTTVDGYTVTLTGTPQPGRTSPLTLTVSRDGKPVTDLEPYLGAYGHLVALRQGDLAYLHVHPEGVPGDGRTLAGPAVSFAAEVPSAGSYRLYLDFRHGGAVHTAEFTVLAGDAPAAPVSTPGTGTSPTAPTPTADAGHGAPGHGHN